MACTGLAALCFGVNLRLVLLVDESGSWQPELKSCEGSEAPLRKSWLWQTPLGWPSSSSNPGLLTPFSRPMRWEKSPEITESKLMLHCPVCSSPALPSAVYFLCSCSGLVLPGLKLAVTCCFSGLSRCVRKPRRSSQCWEHGLQGWEWGGAVSQPPAGAFWCQWAAGVHLGVTYSLYSDTVASNAQELNITVPAVIQPLMLSSHGIICQGPSPAFTGRFCWCRIPAEIAKPSGMLLLGFKLV